MDETTKANIEKLRAELAEKRQRRDSYRPGGAGIGHAEFRQLSEDIARDEQLIEHAEAFHAQGS